MAYLTPSTSNWTCVVGNLADKVMDYGTNNIFTEFSLNHSEAPVGETIADNSEFVKEALKELKKHPGCPESGLDAFSAISCDLPAALVSNFIPLLSAMD